MARSTEYAPLILFVAMTALFLKESPGTVTTRRTYCLHCSQVDLHYL